MPLHQRMPICQLTASVSPLCVTGELGGESDARVLRPSGWVSAPKPARFAPPDEEKLAKMSEKEKTLRELAEELGFSVTADTKILNDLAHSIGSRMTHRKGENVYQMCDLIIPNFPLSLAMKIFP